MSWSHPKLALVVEDDPAMREFLRETLHSAAYTVIAVEDGLDALRYLEADVPDVMVLDLDLPRVHGRDVHRELKAQGLDGRVPVVVVTGTTEVLPVQEFAFVLRKPVDPDVLCAVVQRALRAAQF
jgi:CheY-like chemotaxis protein